MTIAVTEFSRGLDKRGAERSINVLAVLKEAKCINRSTNMSGIVKQVTVRPENQWRKYYMYVKMDQNSEIH